MGKACTLPIELLDELKDSSHVVPPDLINRSQHGLRGLPDPIFRIETVAGFDLLCFFPRTERPSVAPDRSANLRLIRRRVVEHI